MRKLLFIISISLSIHSFGDEDELDFLTSLVGAVTDIQNSDVSTGDTLGIADYVDVVIPDSTLNKYPFLRAYSHIEEYKPSKLNKGEVQALAKSFIDSGYIDHLEIIIQYADVNCDEYKNFSTSKKNCKKAYFELVRLYEEIQMQKSLDIDSRLGEYSSSLDDVGKEAPTSIHDRSSFSPLSKGDYSEVRTTTDFSNKEDESPNSCSIDSVVPIKIPADLKDLEEDTVASLITYLQENHNIVNKEDPKQVKFIIDAYCSVLAYKKENLSQEAFQDFLLFELYLMMPEVDQIMPCEA